MWVKRICQIHDWWGSVKNIMIQSDWIDPCKQISDSEIPSALGIAHFIMLPLNGLSRFFFFFPIYLYLLHVGYIKWHYSRYFKAKHKALVILFLVLRKNLTRPPNDMGSNSLQRRLQCVECCSWAPSVLIYKSALEIIACISNNLDWV